MQGVTVDLSGGGMQLRVAQALPINTLVYVELPVDEAVYLLKSRVCRVVPPLEKGQLQSIALEFLDPPPQVVKHIVRFTQNKQRQIIGRGI